MTVQIDTIEACAKFCAQLVREGITFDCRENRGGFLITCTGGF